MERAATNIEKKLAVGALGGAASAAATVHIRQLQNATIGPGVGFIDEWILHNAVISGDINFGTLDYANEELTTISFTLQYDWATFTPTP